MKLRKGFIVGIVSLLGVTALAGCKKKGEEITLKKVSINGIQRTYEEGDTIDWSALTVTATYSDATSQTFTKFEFDVNSVVKAETQAVVYTSGLHDQETVTDGVYAISVALPSDLSTKYSAGNIAVGNATPDSYALVEFSDPSLKSGYTANIKDAGTDIEPERNDKEAAKANENKFVSSNTQYVVGTFNPFIYEPEVSFENLADPTEELISGDDIHFRKTHTVKVLNGSEFVPASLSDYTVVDGHVKFNDSAIGKTFSLTVSLTDFDTVEGTSKKAESTFSGFTVKKGLNIYNAKQLGILNISKLTTAQLSEQKYNEHHGDTDNMFWNGHEYYRPVLNEVWRDFLTASGTFTANELQAFADTPAVFLQRKLEIKPADIPAGYFITNNEPASAIVGCLRDSIPLYAPIVGNSDVEFNGNFWTLDTTALPLCKNDRSNNGPVPYDPNQEDVIIMPGHTPLIKFCGIESSSDDVFYEQERANSLGNGIVRNINTIGNTGTDLVSKDFDKMLTLTGLIFVKNDYCGAIYENCIIKQYQIGIFPNSMPGQAIHDRDQVDTTFVNNTRMYDCANSGVFNYYNGGTLVSKSVFNRFGASPVMNAGAERENRASNTKFAPDVIFNNEITGEEIYFSALGATEAVGTIKAFNGLFESIGNQFVYTVKDKNNQDVQVMNLVSIGINGDDYLDADTPSYHSNVVLNAGATNELKASVVANTNQWNLYSNLRETIRQAEYDKAYAEQRNSEQVIAMYNAAYAQKRNSDEVVAMYNAAYAQQRNSDEVVAMYNAAYAQERNSETTLALLDGAARQYILEHYESFPPVTPSTDPADIPQDYVEGVKANEEFLAGFEAEFKAQFDAGFEAQFKATFDPAFEAEFKAQFDAGFEAEFKAQFDEAFEAAFDEQFQQPPVFQTEVASEIFWTDLTEFKTITGTKYSTQLQGNYLHLIVPVGSTCLSLVFRISKLPTPTLA